MVPGYINVQLARPNIKTHRLLCSSSITPFSVSPPNPPHRGHGPPLEVLGHWSLVKTIYPYLTLNQLNSLDMKK